MGYQPDPPPPPPSRSEFGERPSRKPSLLEHILTGVALISTMVWVAVDSSSTTASPPAITASDLVTAHELLNGIDAGALDMSAHHLVAGSASTDFVQDSTTTRVGGDLLRVTNNGATQLAVDYHGNVRIPGDLEVGGRITQAKPETSAPNDTRERGGWAMLGQLFAGLIALAAVHQFLTKRRV